MKLRMLFDGSGNGFYNIELLIYNSVGCSRTLFSLVKFPGEDLTISWGRSSSGKIERIIKYCNEEYLILNFSVRVNFSSDIGERYDIELGELMDLYSNDLSVMRSKLKELEEKYQQIGWF